MSLKTEIFLLPVKVPLNDLSQPLSIFFENKIIIPEKIGSISKTKPVKGKTNQETVAEIIDYLRNDLSVLVHGKDKRYLDVGIFRNEQLPYSGMWSHYSIKDNPKEFTTDVYNDVIAEFFALLPIAIASTHFEEARQFYTYRIEERNVGRERVTNVKNIGEGLAYPPWKAWYGKPYVDAVGRDKLLSAPCYYNKEYPSAILVCLYEKPSEWQEKNNLEMAERFKKHVGPEYFFDQKNPGRKLKTPFN
jgi:hypothetical protein